MTRSSVPSLVWVVALVGAAACARPAARVTAGDEAPEAFVGQSRIRDIFVNEGAFWRSPPLEAPDGATRVAVWLSTFDDAVDAPLRIDARGLREDGSATAWRALDERWAEAPQRVLRAELNELVVAVELRVADADLDKLARVVWSAVTPDPEVAARVDGQREIEIGAGAPIVERSAITLEGVEPRSAWNARADAGCSSNVPKDWISVHHSVSALQPNASRATHASAVRGIQSYHMDGRGYCDMGYHFATTADGTVWEGRDASHLGAHTGSHNTNNAGIVFIGCFHPVSDCDGLGGLTPPDVMLQGGGAAIGRIADHYGIAITAANIIGHRDNPDQSTSCPGDNLHDLLPTLRDIAADGGGVVPPATGRVQGTVWDLSITTDAAQSEALGARLPGATVTVTGGPTTTARAGDAYWVFDLDPGTYTLTATLDGFAPSSREVQITAGGAGWASIGIAPSPQAVSVTVRVVDDETDAPVQNATVTITGVDPQQTAADGTVSASLSAGEATISVTAEGYEPETVIRTFAAAAVETVDVRLVADEIIKPGEGEGEHETDPNQVERVTILPPKNAGGCAGTDPDESGPLVVLFLSLAMLSASYRKRPATRP